MSSDTSIFHFFYDHQTLKVEKWHVTQKNCHFYAKTSSLWQKQKKLTRIDLQRFGNVWKFKFYSNQNFLKINFSKRCQRLDVLCVQWLLDVSLHASLCRFFIVRWTRECKSIFGENKFIKNEKRKMLFNFTFIPEHASRMVCARGRVYGTCCQRAKHIEYDITWVMNLPAQMNI
jgi:hypothetical protein